MTAVEIFFNDLVNQGFIEYRDDSLVQNIFNAALELEKQQSQDYAKFAINCDRKEMRILNFEDYIKL
jgi:hypothetical protein